MQTTLPALHRRDWLTQGLGALAAAGICSFSWAAGEGLPEARSLPQALDKALAQGQPLLVMVSLEGCV